MRTIEMKARHMGRILTASLIALALLAGAGISQQKRQQDVDLQAAIRKESVDGDLKSAIKMYQKIAGNYKADHAVAAQALLHMAECYEKLGDSQASAIFRRVISEYGDQADAVATARVRLARTDAMARMVSTMVWGGAQPTSVSSDGRFVSYAKDGDLFIHEVASGMDRDITTRGTDIGGIVQASVISRDDKQIAYRWWLPAERRSELWLTSLGGDAKPRRLLGDPDITWVGPYDWSADGKWFVAALERKDGASQIGLISVPEGSVRVLKSVDGRRTHPRAKECSFCDMHFSPDGKYLGYDLYENNTGNERDVFVISVDGTHQVPAVVRVGNDEMLGWSADGKWLLFTSERTGSMDLWAVAFDGGEIHGEPRWLKEDLGKNSWPLGLTSSGALYYLTNSGAGRSRLWSLENFLPKTPVATR